MSQTRVRFRVEVEFDVVLEGIYSSPDEARNIARGRIDRLELYARSGTRLVAPVVDRDVTLLEVDEDDDYDYTDEDD
jgi:hypothetical protein